MNLSDVKNVFVVNLYGKSFSEYSKGELNRSFCELAESFFRSRGCEIRRTNVAEGYDVEEELDKYQWADLVFYQSPTYSMGMGWEAKKWADEVWTAGMGGALCNGDGRTRKAPQDNYGAGGTLTGKPYMLSVTFNAPKGAFERPDEYLFQGKTVDDLWFPFHANNRFFGMENIPDSTFATFDVMKNPRIEEDHQLFKEHLEKLFHELPAKEE